MVCDYLCESDWLVFGNVICIFACEHSTVTTIHLLWDFLRGEIKMVSALLHVDWTTGRSEYPLLVWLQSMKQTKNRLFNALHPHMCSTYIPLFAVQSPAWGIHVFALLVLTFLLQVITGRTKRFPDSSFFASWKLIFNCYIQIPKHKINKRVWV